MIDGPIAPLPCLSRKAYHPCEDCRDEAACRIRKVFGDLFSAYLLMLEVADPRRPHAQTIPSSPSARSSRPSSNHLKSLRPAAAHFAC